MKCESCHKPLTDEEEFWLPNECFTSLNYRPLCTKCLDANDGSYQVFENERRPTLVKEDHPHD